MNDPHGGTRDGRTAAARWKLRRRAARAAVIRAVVTLLGLLPLPVAFAIGAALGRLGWALSSGLRRDMRASLAIAFPERSAAERDAIGRATAANLGKVAAEVVTMRRWAHRLDTHVEASPQTLALVESAWARKKGIIFVLGHIGNWELTARLSRLVQPNAAIAKRSWHPSLDAIMERFRASNGVGTYWRDDPATGRSMLKLFRQGGALGILIDQDIRDVQSVFVPFFGRLAATPRAAADFALRFGAAVLVVTCSRKGPGVWDGHRLEVVEVPYDAAAADREAEVVRLTAACARVQEDAIRRSPAEWVWMHQRWKTRPPEAVADAADATRRAG
jgi:Kdo2-lipid IVA lauroyltransferase/acyltransferase